MVHRIRRGIGRESGFRGMRGAVGGRRRERRVNRGLNVFNKISLSGKGAGTLPSVIGSASPASEFHWLPHLRASVASSSALVASLDEAFRFSGPSRDCHPLKQRPASLLAILQTYKPAKPAPVSMTTRHWPNGPRLTEHYPMQAHPDWQGNERARPGI